MTTTPTDKIRLLVVDDHPVVRDGLVSILHEGEPDLEVVGQAGDGKDFFKDVFVFHNWVQRHAATFCRHRTASRYATRWDCRLA